MRIPKRIKVCGKTYTVSTNPEHDGGSVNFDKRHIEIGTFDKDEAKENLIHELGEAIMAERDFRYVPEKQELENADFRFFLTHADWQLFCKDLAIALNGISFK